MSDFSLMDAIECGIVKLQTALEALYGHYEKTFKLWQGSGIKVPPCFIIVCQNTAISKLVYDYVSGFQRKNEDGTATLVNGRLALFRNFDEGTGNPLPRPNTLLIDSEQLEAGDALDDYFRGMAADEIERFRREIVERSGDAHAVDNITDQELLREVMITVGKPGQLGAAIRCPLRLDADRRLGRQYRHSRPGHPCLWHAASVRAGDWPRVAPSLV
jgi:type III restriction enzyme